MTSHTFHAISSHIRALNPLGFRNTTQSDWFDSLVQQQTFQAFTSPFRASNPLKFPNGKRSDRLDSPEQRYI
ncbi:uncharacterized protein G2W53_015341 [Senna tora]|uniref:Uncharacterized protein n=1 Tax=Senna tora TaxID=362788 RepID=A0A834WVV9_9FABA|nr:uncharacterized protein G2W53_015341 [Senna tora]